MSNAPEFNAEQIEWIFYKIAQWFFLNKDDLTKCYDGTCKLGVSIKQLKQMICPGGDANGLF